MMKFRFSVLDITINSPAEHSELKVGDEIIEINGNQTIKDSYSKIENYIKSSGNNLELTIRRKKERGHDDIETEFKAGNEEFLTNFSS